MRGGKMQESLNIIKLDNTVMSRGTFEGTLKKWGSSIGVVVPKEIMKEQELKVGDKVTFMIIPQNMERLRKLIGTVKFTKSTDEIMRETDEGWDDND